ncbi:hypothetical protein ABPG74_017993 [Tetrahymena malaccensis]
MSEQKASEAYEEFFTYQNNIGQTSFWVTDDNDDDATLVVNFAGEDNTIHQGALYQAKFKFTEKYPQEKPQGAFCQPAPYHCNIKEDGYFCLQYYNNWNSKCSFFELVEILNHFIYDPNPSSPLRSEIAREMKENIQLYEQKVKNQASDCRSKFQ